MLALAWPTSPLTLLIFVAWVPLLYIAEVEKKVGRFFLYSLLSMFIWNAGTTWWIWNATPAGAVGAIVINSFFMSIPLWGFYIIKQKYTKTAAVLSFVAFWLCFEYVHLTWQLSWPWLTLGNVFAMHTNWIQWYEFTGVSGGSLWVLVVNVAIAHLIIFYKTGAKATLFATAILALAVPFVVSGLVNPKKNASTTTGKKDYNVVVVQPNIDPYNEKFNPASTSEQLKKLIKLSEDAADFKTALVLWPETALPVPVWQDMVEQKAEYQPVFDFVNRHPWLTLQTGIETYKNYGTQKATKTAHRSGPNGFYFDAFNAAVMIRASQPLQFYNKSKLVPGVETLPDFLLWLGAIFEQFGGTAGGYGHDEEAASFAANGEPYVTAPIICYESIYGEYVTDYVKKGANLLTIMTNDGWWADTEGHRQHLQYARLRAIETRKWVARSANTGISAVINSSGDIVASRPWNVASAIKYNIPMAEGETFFVKHGSIIFYLAGFFTVLAVVFHWTLVIKGRLQKRKLPG